MDLWDVVIHYINTEKQHQRTKTYKTQVFALNKSLARKKGQDIFNNMTEFLPFEIKNIEIFFYGKVDI